MQGKDQKGDIKKPPVKKIFSPKPRKGKKEGKKEGKKQWRALRSLSIIENIVDSEIYAKEGQEKESCVACEENERRTGGNDAGIKVGNGIDV